MRMLLAAVLVVGSSVMAQAIGGTVSATYLDSNQGVPSVQVDVNLTCSLTCDAAAPTKHFKIATGMRSWYAAAPTESAGFSSLFSMDLDLDGQASSVSTSFKPGQTVFLKAQGVTCQCGGRDGEGGYIDLSTPNVVIPANIVSQTSVRVGDHVFFSAAADLRGSEQVELKAVGGGLDTAKAFGVADLSSQGYAIYDLTFTEPGTATVTAKLLPSGVTSTETWNVTARAGPLGGGGGSSSTGGGSGGGDGVAPQGCTTTGGLSVLASLALVLARRRR